MLKPYNRRNQTPTKDFLIAPHPRTANLHVATGGSGHGFKFLPIIGDLIVDSVEGTLPPELEGKWAFREHKGPNKQVGEPKELKNVIRSRI